MHFQGGLFYCAYNNSLKPFPYIRIIYTRERYIRLNADFSDLCDISKKQPEHARCIEGLFQELRAAAAKRRTGRSVHNLGSAQSNRRGSSLQACMLKSRSEFPLASAIVQRAAVQPPRAHIPPMSKMGKHIRES